MGGMRTVDWMELKKRLENRGISHEGPRKQGQKKDGVSSRSILVLRGKKKADTRNGCEQPPARPPDRTRESGGVVRQAGAPRTAESAKSKRATEDPIVP